MQWRRIMKKSMKIALAFVAVASAAGGAAIAAEGRWDRAFGPRHGMAFDRADADANGDVTFDEFAAAMNSRMGTVDADKDGRMTVAEIAAEIERMRAERMARRLLERFDADGDGALTAAEIEAHQKKMFARLDRDDDGKILEEELPRRGGGRGNR